MGKSQRDKGKRWEGDFKRRAVEKGIPAYRNTQSRGEEREGPDVCLLQKKERGHVRRLSVWALDVECKADQGLSVPAIARILRTNDACAVQVDGVGKFVALNLDTFLEMLSDARDHCVDVDVEEEE